MREHVFEDKDFDDWADLARNDPERFEQRRREVIEEFIDNAPEERQAFLRRVQWRVDMERRRASNPTAACVRLYEMMWEAFAGERGLATMLKHGVEMPIEGRRAKVLQFPEGGRATHVRH